MASCNSGGVSGRRQRQVEGDCAVTGSGKSSGEPMSMTTQTNFSGIIHLVVIDAKKYRDEWKETGCTVLCDNWSDGRIGSLVVFSVACPKGTLFLKSVDVSGHEHDSTYLFELLESVVLEVGLENVVQVITDASAGYVCARRLLTARYSFLFWSPCVAYYIDKMLEDIGRQDWVSTVLEDAKTITQYIYGHAWILNIMKKFTGGKELIRPKITRFVTDFLSLRSIVMQEGNLKHMFSHSEWLSSMYSKRPDAQAIKSLLYSDKFWKHAHEAVSVSEPLVKLLRMVDGDMPAMGYIYEGMESAKVVIKAYYKGVESYSSKPGGVFMYFCSLRIPFMKALLTSI
ncbi:uncharacterized protein LOC106766634 [Vigna radiata var. radiata]|uniref:Uncharacterized protein LOC106766634 n=1 Tax=Vigna radiata var. radiata TaxID=3916 RepID=A0A1S3ULF8_VIGRR|nr:uncharacterized protein LOC106766634 [Vigna radiata var. radiata]